MRYFANRQIMLMSIVIAKVLGKNINQFVMLSVNEMI